MKNGMEEIRIFVTGGTIEGIEKDLGERGTGKTCIPELLEDIGVGHGYPVEVLMLKDSRDIGEKDREAIFRKCAGCAEKKIIIIHGTWTMPLTAKYLGKRGIGKTIVLVGSRVPAKEKGSDAKANLAFAIGSVQKLPAGVYITMDGKVFSHENVRKNPDTGFFEEEV